MSLFVREKDTKAVIEDAYTTAHSFVECQRMFKESGDAQWLTRRDSFRDEFYERQKRAKSGARWKAHVMLSNRYRGDTSQVDLYDMLAMELLNEVNPDRPRVVFKTGPSDGSNSIQREDPGVMDIEDVRSHLATDHGVDARRFSLGEVAMAHLSAHR